MKKKNKNRRLKLKKTGQTELHWFTLEKGGPSWQILNFFTSTSMSVSMLHMYFLFFFFTNTASDISSRKKKKEKRKTAAQVILINNITWTAYLKHPPKHQLPPPLLHPPFLVHSLKTSLITTTTLSSLAFPKSCFINYNWSKTVLLISSPTPPCTITSPPSCRVSTGSQSNNAPFFYVFYHLISTAANLLIS